VELKLSGDLLIGSLQNELHVGDDIAADLHVESEVDRVPRVQSYVADSLVLSHWVRIVGHRPAYVYVELQVPQRGRKGLQRHFDLFRVEVLNSQDLHLIFVLTLLMAKVDDF
jgi:hypothetical protein